MTTLEGARTSVEDGLATIDGEQYYVINDVDHMPPFLMSVVSDGSVVFEEQRHDLGLIFSYRWSSSATFGFVRTATVRNDGGVGAR